MMYRRERGGSNNFRWLDRATDGMDLEHLPSSNDQEQEKRQAREAFCFRRVVVDGVCSHGARFVASPLLRPPR